MSRALRKRIVAIVEGHGEVRAVPALVDRWIKLHGLYDRYEVVDRAVRASGAGALKCAHVSKSDLGIEHYVEAALRARPAAILVVLDADDECREREKTGGRKLAFDLVTRAQAVATHVPIGVVVADREFEAWFIHFRDQLSSSLPRAEYWRPPSLTIEEIRDCKGVVSQLLGRAYEPTVDQSRLVRGLPLDPSSSARCRSYHKLLRELTRLMPP